MNIVESTLNIKPLLKWAGGKTQLLKVIHKRVPKNYNNYIEPFFGGGSVLFYLRPSQAIVNDINKELIDVYKTIKTNSSKLISELRTYKNDANFFYKSRDMSKDKKAFAKLTKIQKAARFIFLNKTCYNGLYRVNKSGQLNTPYGKYINPTICDEQLIKNLSIFFKSNNVLFFNKDFSSLLNEVHKNDFVYLDPPYDPISKTSSFTSYTNKGFSKEDQERLKVFCEKIDKKGAFFMLSNSNTPFIKNMYKEYRIELIGVNRTINCKANQRKKIKEVLIRNY